MPKRGSFSFFPRKKEAEDQEGPARTRHVIVDYEALEGLFHLPLKDAARELGLCQTTFKKACRGFDVAHWPFRKGQNCAPQRERKAQTDGVDAAINTHLQKHAYAPAAPTLQTTEVQQAMRAVTESCTSPGWHDGSIAWRDTSAASFSFFSTASSNSTVTASSELHWNCPDPFGAVFSSAAPHDLLQQASMALDTRSCGEARNTCGQGFQHTAFAPLDAPSCIDSSSRGCICIGVPMPECLARTGACGWEQGGDTPLKEGPPRQRSCVEAVMEYLDGPLVGNFDFMFADEEGGAAGVEYLPLGCSISEDY